MINVKLYEYSDYEHYYVSQVKANLQKIDTSWVQENDIETICDYIKKHNIKHKNIICHGTRRGLEQKYFKMYLQNIEYIIGTEISPSATQFEDTIQHDFHEVRKDWLGYFDVVYTNSWDHSYDYKKSLNTWIDSLVVGGYLFIEWSENNMIDAGHEIDPFRASYDDYEEIFSNREKIEIEGTTVVESAQSDGLKLSKKHYFILRKI